MLFLRFLFYFCNENRMVLPDWKIKPAQLTERLMSLGIIWALNCSPMMPRDASLWNSCTLHRCSFFYSVWWYSKPVMKFLSPHSEISSWSISQIGFTDDQISQMNLYAKLNILIPGVFVLRRYCLKLTMSCLKGLNLRFLFFHRNHK